MQGSKLSKVNPVYLAMIAGFLFALGLMLIDELVTLLIYCSNCWYQLPLIGVTLHPYDTEILAWLLIFSAFLIGGWAVAIRNPSKVLNTQ